MGALKSTDDKVIVGIMGVNRGSALAPQFAAVPGVEIRYLCDIDSQRLAVFHEAFSKTVDYAVKIVGDFRKMLDDPELDVMVCAAPNHWHAPASILAAPLANMFMLRNLAVITREGELLIEAARKHQRCVQMGNQRRSGEKLSKR